jgi:hypothetical protein
MDADVNLSTKTRRGRQRPQGRKVMKQEDPPASREPATPGGEADQYLSTRGLLIVFAGIAVALVLGYLLLNKLVNISQEEDCALAHRYNCGAVEVPR